MSRMDFDEYKDDDYFGEEDVIVSKTDRVMQDKRARNLDLFSQISELYGSDFKTESRDYHSLNLEGFDSYRSYRGKKGRKISLQLFKDNLKEDGSAEVFIRNMNWIHLVTKKGFVESLIYLIRDWKIDPNLQTEIQKDTCLHIALEYLSSDYSDHLEIIQYLLSLRNIDIHLPNKQGITAFEKAREMKSHILFDMFKSRLEVDFESQLSKRVPEILNILSKIKNKKIGIWSSLMNFVYGKNSDLDNSGISEEILIKLMSGQINVEIPKERLYEYFDFFKRNKLQYLTFYCCDVLDEISKYRNLIFLLKRSEVKNYEHLEKIRKKKKSEEDESLYHVNSWVDEENKKRKRKRKKKKKKKAEKFGYTSKKSAGWYNKHLEEPWEKNWSENSTKPKQLLKEWEEEEIDNRENLEINKNHETTMNIEEEEEEIEEFCVPSSFTVEILNILKKEQTHWQSNSMNVRLFSSEGLLSRILLHPVTDIFYYHEFSNICEYFESEYKRIRYKPHEILWIAKVSEIYETNRLWNVILVSNDNVEFQCHLEILLCKSNFFFSMINFKGQEREELINSGKIILKNFSSLEVSVYLEFLYLCNFYDCGGINNRNRIEQNYNPSDTKDPEEYVFGRNKLLEVKGIDADKKITDIEVRKVSESFPIFIKFLQHAEMFQEHILRTKVLHSLGIFVGSIYDRFQLNTMLLKHGYLISMELPEIYKERIIRDWRKSFLKFDRSWRIYGDKKSIDSREKDFEDLLKHCIGESEKFYKENKSLKTENEKLRLQIEELKKKMKNEQPILVENEDEEEGEEED